jgi:hypothetical protein
MPTSVSDEAQAIVGSSFLASKRNREWDGRELSSRSPTSRLLWSRPASSLTRFSLTRLNLPTGYAVSRLYQFLSSLDSPQIKS